MLIVCLSVCRSATRAFTTRRSQMRRRRRSPRRPVLKTSHRVLSVAPGDLTRQHDEAAVASHLRAPQSDSTVRPPCGQPGRHHAMRMIRPPLAPTPESGNAQPVRFYGPASPERSPVRRPVRRTIDRAARALTTSATSAAIKPFDASRGQARKPRQASRLGRPTRELSEELVAAEGRSFRSWTPHAKTKSTHAARG
jgi:hypothetical protein